MDFTREPIIETVITPKEGCTLVVRSSKSSGQEEYFVDAIEVVIFGNAIFFRSRERPKAFLVPATDYEILEVRETRLVLKNVGLDRSIKIAGGREAPLRQNREVSGAKADRLVAPPEKPLTLAPPPQGTPLEGSEDVGSEEKSELRLEKKRDRRRNYRRRRGKEDETTKASEETAESHPVEAGTVELPAPDLTKEEIASSAASAPVAAVLSSLLAPPPNLISETIGRYKDNALFKGAFFLKDEDEAGDSKETLSEENEDFSEEDFHAKHLTETLFDSEEIEVPQMSLDYPIYGEVEQPDDNESFKEDEAFLPSDEPLFTEQIAHEAISERALENAFEVKEALEEARLTEEENIANASVSIEDGNIGSQEPEDALEDPLNPKEVDQHLVDPS